MAVENIAAASSAAISQDSGQSGEQDRISELVRLERDVQRLKSDCRNKAKSNGMAQNEINSKIRKYEQLIAKIEQEIHQIKKKVSSKPVDLKKGAEKQGVYARGRDSTELSVAALKASYRMLVPEADVVSSEADVVDKTAKNNLDQLV